MEHQAVMGAKASSGAVYARVMFILAGTEMVLKGKEFIFRVVSNGLQKLSVTLKRKFLKMLSE